jgi:TP901 family phage tail tape measure protein
MADFTLTAQLRLQAPSNVNQIVNQMRNQIGDIRVNLSVRASNSLNTVQKQLQDIKTTANDASDGITKFGSQAALAAKRFLAFSIVTTGFLKLTNAIKNGLNDAIEFEREVFKISQVTGTAVRDLQDLTKEVTKLSTGLGVSSKELLNVAQVLSQAGLTAEDTKRSLEALAKSGLSPTFDSIAETGEGVIAIMAQFGVRADQLEDKLSSLNSVAGKFAVESSDLITVVRRTGGAFQAAGGSLEELISLFTSVRATTRESAESIATGFRTIFTRLQRIRTVNFLSNIGVELRDLEGQFVD